MFKPALRPALPLRSRWLHAPWHFSTVRHFVTPQDVKTVAMDVLRHRVSVTYEAEGREHHFHEYH